MFIHDLSMTEFLHTTCAPNKVHFADSKFNKQFVSHISVGMQNGYSGGYQYSIEYKCTLGIV